MSSTVACYRLLTAVICFLPLLLNAASVPLALLPHARVEAPAVTPSAFFSSWRRQHPQVRVGTWLPAHPPYRVDIDPHSMEGLTAEYLFLLQQTLAIPFIVEHYADRQAALQALQSGEIDLLPATPQLASEYPELRLSSVWFPDRAVLIHQPTSRLNLEQGLAGKTLNYRSDGTLYETLKSAFPQAKPLAMDDIYASVAAVANNDHVVMFSNKVTAEEINSRIYENQLMIEESPVAADQSLVFAARQDAKPLLDQIDAVRQTISQRDQAQIADAWRLATPFMHTTSRPELTAEQREWIKQHPVVPVLITHTHEPMTFINEEGEESGFIISLLQRIGQQSGITFRWQNFENLSEMRAHLRDHPDALIALADASATQESGVVYSRPYQISSWVLVTRKDGPAIHTLDDMSGRTVAVYPGSYYLPALRKQFPQVKFIEENFSLETVFALWTRSLDGAVLPQNAAGFFLKSYLADRFKIANILPIPPLKMAMATSEQNRVLLSIINQALLDIPPQTMDAQLSGWQLRFTLERLNAWGRYQNLIIVSIASLIVIALMLIFFFWRNRLLKNNLAVQEKLRQGLQEAKSRVDKISESKSLFLSQMSHEIRTPMNALIGLLELENQGKSPPEQRKNNIAVACESARSLLMLLGDILDMAKIESGTVNVRSQPVSLSETLNSITTLFRYSADEKGLKLITTLEVTDDTLLFDPVLFKQILSNLLSNAIKFTSHGEVEVAIYQAAKRSDEQGDYVLEVCDTGIGLTADQQKAIFEPFVQVESSRSTHYGTGLGLSICRQLSELLGGTLNVDSTPGEGTSFIFRFSAPYWRGNKQDWDLSPPIAETASRFILIVDDHAPNRLLLSQQLAFAGHRCVAVENGEQALQSWLQASPPFDMVITDCNMPVMNGFELVRKLREKERALGRLPQPMLGLTAMAEQAVRAHAEAAGMTGCLFKPVGLAELLASISQQPEESLPEHSIDPSIVLTLDKLAQSQPETYMQLIQLMVAQNQRDREGLMIALAQGDYPQIKHIAHSLLGGARLIHCTALAEVCQRLEQAAEAEDNAQVLILATACQTEIDTLDAGLRQVLKEQSQ